MLDAMAGVASCTVQDHAGHDVHMTWPQGKDNLDDPAAIAAFAFPVYFVSHAVIVSDPRALAMRLYRTLSRIWRRHDDVVDIRFDLYTSPTRDILSAVAHHRREMDWRNRNQIWPRIVPDWAHRGLPGSYGGFLLTFDNESLSPPVFTSVRFDRVGPVSASALPSYRNAPPLVKGDYLREVDLVRRWAEAGGEAMDSVLARRNAGGQSPALYPAMDPDARLDAEADTEDLDDPSSSDARGQGSGIGLMEELMLPDNELGHLRSMVYYDLLDFPVVSVWNPRVSMARPDFAVTLYRPPAGLSFRPRAIFQALDSGMAADTPWCLDVVDNISTIEHAYAYHRRASLMRTREATSAHADVSGTILRKVVGNRLPTELVDLIKAFMVPPHIPNYSSSALSDRLFQHLFLWLDAQRAASGPSMVYSQSRWFEEAREAYKTSQHPIWLPGGLPALRVHNFGRWRHVSAALYDTWRYHG